MQVAEKRGLTRVLSAILCIVFMLAGCSLIVYSTGSQMQRFLKDIPSLKNNLEEIVKTSRQWIQVHYNIDYGIQADYINRSVDGLVNAMGVTLATFLKVVVFATLSTFFIFYILLYRDALKTLVLFPFNRINKTKISGMPSELTSIISNYVKGLLIEMSILIFLSSIKLLIMGVKYALLMAIFAGLFNIIPYIDIYTAAF